MTVNGGWGPQPTGGVAPPRERVPGWPAVLLVSWVWIALSITDVIAQPTFMRGVQIVAVLAIIVGFVAGWRRRADFAGQVRWIIAVLVCANPPAVLGYFLGYLVGLPVGGLFGATRSVARAASNSGPTNDIARISNTKPGQDAFQRLYEAASRQYGRPGAHVGWHEGEYIGANPRGATLVIGPPGSGKSAGVIIPSVIAAPGACVSSTVKLEVLEATWRVRAVFGRVWHFDPGGDETPPPGVLRARWSPMVGIRSWSDARAAANRLADPAIKAIENSGGDAHFIKRARDWCEVLLYAAHLDGLDIAQVADWAQNPDTEEVEVAVNTVLDHAAQHGNESARIAAGQHRALLSIPDRERGSIKSSIQDIMRIYGDLAARAIGASPNFDPAQFVRSTDTLYITASPDRQQEYAPLLAGLLEAIRFATYQRHKAEEQGVEPKRPHVTFVLDEANNTAPIPLPAIVSEAGGQSLHVIVGIQDLSRARARWGREADGFLTLFPTKVVLNGVVEPYTLDALSKASGEYDRLMQSVSQSTTYHGSTPIVTNNPSWTTQRQAVLHQGDIAQLPPGKALLFVGAQHYLVDIGMHFNSPAWTAIYRAADMVLQSRPRIPESNAHNIIEGTVER